MTDENIHPDTGADDAEAAKIWADMDKAEAAAAAEPEPKEPDPAAQADEPAEGSQPADKPADQPAGTADAAPAATPDIWANATPEQRAAYDEATRKLNETNDRYRRVSGTVSALQRKINAYEKGQPAPKGAQPKAAEKPGAQPKDEPKKPTSILDDPDLAKVEAEYPEVIGPLKKGFKTLEERTESMQRKLDAMDEAEFDAHIEQQVDYVVSQHPDYKKLRSSPEFKKWREQAPQFVHDGIARNAQVIVDGHEVATIVEMFKRDTGWGRPATQQPAAAAAPGTQQPAVSDKRKAQLESAAAPRGRGPAPHTGQPETDEDWWNHFEEQDRRAARR